MSEPSKPNQVDVYRRKFMAVLSGAAATVLAPSLAVRAVDSAVADKSAMDGSVMKVRPLTQPVTDEVRWGLLIDIEQLQDGGATMVAACQREHGWGDDPKASPEQQAQWIRTVTVTDQQSGREFTLPVMCQHCETAPCVDVCPTGASMRRADGIVQVNKHTCIGCRYCMMACPYKARSFVHESLEDQLPHSPRGKGTVESCNLCVHRIDAGRLPACVEAEPEAVIFGDLNDPNSRIRQALAAQGGQQIRADLQLNNGVRYQGL